MKMVVGKQTSYTHLLSTVVALSLFAVFVHVLPVTKKRQA